MNEELIRDIVDIQANKQVEKLTADLTANNKQLQDNIISAKTLNDVLAQSKGFAEFNKNTQASAKAQEQLAKLTATRQLAEEKLQAFREQAQAKRDAIEAKQKAIDDARLKRIADLEAKEQQASQKKTEYLKIADEELKRQKDALRTMPKQLEEYDKLSKEYNKAAKEAQNLGARLILLEREYGSEKTTVEKVKIKALTNAYKDASSNAGKLHSELLTLDQSVGKSNRNVGNYKSGWNGLSNSINQITRELPAFTFSAQTGFLALSNNIPILTDEIGKLSKANKELRAQGQPTTSVFKQIASSVLSLQTLMGVGILLFTVYGKEIGSFVTALFKGTKALNQFKLEQEDLNKALSGSEFSKAVTNVNELRINIDLAKKGFLDKKDVLKQYNETIGKTTGEVKSLDEAEIALTKNADAFIKMTLYKAAAQVALESAAKAAYEAEISRRKKLEEFGNEFLDASVSNVRSESQYKSNQQNIINQRKKRQADEVKISQDSADQQINIAKKFQEDAAKIAKNKNNNFNFFDPTKTTKTPKAKTPKATKTDNTESEERRNSAALIQIQVSNLKEAQRYYDEGANNENSSLEKRLEQLKKYGEVSEEIIKVEAEKEKAGKKLTANEIFALDNETQNKRTKLIEDQAKKVLSITADELKKSKDLIAKKSVSDLQAIETARDKELIELNERGLKGKEYADEKERIEEEYTKKYIELQIKQSQAFLDQAKLRGEDTEDAEAKLYAIKLKYSELAISQDEKEANAKKKTDEEILKNKLEKQEKYIEIGQALFDFTQTLSKVGSERRLNELSDEKDALDLKRQSEIDAVTQSTASEEEKADKIAIINAKADADQQIIEQRVKAEKIKQAKADKAAAIAQAIISGALAVLKVTSQTGILAPFIIPSIVALTAIQVASIIAQPIPKYKDGKNKGNNYSGMAWVGDGGMSELVIEPNGSMWATPNTPTLTHVSRDTQVISGPEFKRMLAKPNNSWQGSGSTTIDISALIASNKKETSRVVKALNSQPNNGQVLTNSGLLAQRNRVERYNNWINRNFN